VTTRNNAWRDNGSAHNRPKGHTLNRPNMVSVGTIIWLSSELMFFAASSPCSSR